MPTERTKPLQVWLTEQEHAMAHALAQREDRSAAALVRHLLAARYREVFGGALIERSEP